MLVSGCIFGWGCGVDGTDYGMSGALQHGRSAEALRAQADTLRKKAAAQLSDVKAWETERHKAPGWALRYAPRTRPAHEGAQGDLLYARGPAVQHRRAVQPPDHPLVEPPLTHEGGRFLVNVRGGCWQTGTSWSRAAYRASDVPRTRLSQLGFRVMAPLP